jgi:hypothetical protein
VVSASARAAGSQLVVHRPLLSTIALEWPGVITASAHVRSRRAGIFGYPLAATWERVAAGEAAQAGAGGAVADLAVGPTS